MIPPHLSQSSCGTSAGAATSANNGTVALSDSQTRQKRGNATSDLQESGVDTSSELPFGAVKHRVWSPVSLCCGFDIRQPFMEPQVEQSPDFQDIAVYTSGSFPCLHIALRGLRPDHAYYLAIDFEEVMAGDEDKWAPQYADPYFIPRPNHRYGARWMKETLYFNLKTIVNGYLEIYGCKLRERGEHLPVLRVHEYCPNLNHLICSVTRIKLPSWAFVITFKRKTKRKLELCLSDFDSDELFVGSRGTPQESNTSTTLFNIYMVGFSRRLTQVRHQSFHLCW